jgi:hypothetical protein
MELDNRTMRTLVEKRMQKIAILMKRDYKERSNEESV